MITPLLHLYALVWAIAMPLLRRSPRISLGWDQRTLAEAPAGPFDIWIQAASGGESILTNMILEGLAAAPVARPLRVLATSGTKQGIDSLMKGRDRLAAGGAIDLTVAYFPFDAPRLMARAFARLAPRLAVVVETELWPAFLVTARRNKVPVFLVNGRMAEKSFRTYRHFSGFFHRYGPEKVLAISPLDGERFGQVVGQERVSLMNNIKFDRIEPQAPASPSPIAGLLAESAPFVLLGSVRREEEEKVLTAIVATLAARPEIVIGLFPKHIERADAWLALLQAAGIPAIKRSLAAGRCRPGTVLVWDVFGELAGAYGLAAATFVGGSLLDLGGQNFLEPLVFGVKPIIGPYWTNFAWVGRDIVAAGLVREVADEQELARALVDALDAPGTRAEVIDQVRTFFTPRKGGTVLVCRQIIEKFQSLDQQDQT